MEKLSEILKNIEQLKNNTKDEVLIEKMLIDLEYLYKKYDKKINPKYYKKLNIKNINILFYKSGINVLVNEDMDEKVFWEILKIIIKNPGFVCIKLRKDKDFSSTSICTSKNFTKIKTWFSGNLIDYEILSVFFVLENKEETEKNLEDLEKNTQN